jgi:hypothetical protein
MQFRDMVNTLRFAGRLLVWCFLILGFGLGGFGVWIWLAHRNDDIASIIGGLSLLGGVYLIAYTVPHVAKRR